MSDVVAPPPPAYKNRRGGLIFFGIVLIAFGLLAALMAVLVASTFLIGGHAQGASAPPPRMLAGIIPFYLAIAGVLMTLGVGSMMARRWARSLTLVLSWMWVIGGVLGSVAMIAMSGAIFAGLPAQQAEARPFMIGCMVVIFGIFGILVPLAFLLFYRSPHVRATVEALDPVPRWTDRVPLPVLTFSCWMFFGAASVLMSTAMYRVLPFGTVLLRGFSATAVMLIFAAISLFIAIGSLKLMPSAWWAALAMFLFGAVYSFVFMTRTNWEAWYTELGMSTDPRQVEMLRAMYSGPFFLTWLVVLWAAYLAFLFYIRRDFFRPGATANP
ncbi:MAG: hypothetical protein ACXVH7_07330 [Thermoanaerobaculia bacterium]